MRCGNLTYAYILKEKSKIFFRFLAISAKNIYFCTNFEILR